MQKIANSKNRAPDAEEHEIPFGPHEVAQINKELSWRRQLRPEVLEDFTKDGNNPHDEECGNQKRNGNDDDGVGHGRLDLLTKTSAGFEETGQPVENFREQTTGFARLDHTDEEAIEDPRMFGN